MDTRSSPKGRYLCLCRTCSMRAAYTKDWRPCKEKWVPVHLGNIRKYDLDLGVRIVHMLLMSWAGETVNEADMANFKEEVAQLVDDLRVQGMVHKDVRALWNAERCRPMLIDFERSTTTYD